MKAELAQSQSNQAIKQGTNNAYSQRIHVEIPPCRSLQRACHRRVCFFRFGLRRHAVAALSLHPAAAGPGRAAGAGRPLRGRKRRGRDAGAAKRQIVSYATREAAGTVIIDTPNTYLYYVLGNGQAIRYGIGVGRDGFTWSGIADGDQQGRVAGLDTRRRK